MCVCLVRRCPEVISISREADFQLRSDGFKAGRVKVEVEVEVCGNIRERASAKIGQMKVWIYCFSLLRCVKDDAFKLRK